jgi:type 2 lantibiotic biosynthesis protein LanM
MEARAIHAPDGSVTWIAPRYLFRAERFQLEPLGFSLYDGTAGVALFLAALEHVTGGAGYRDLALGALNALHQALSHAPQRAASALGIGGALGLGSVVYALTRSSQWLEAPLLLEDAKQAAALITSERIAQDGALDILAGSAGALLGLLTLHGAAPYPSTLASAVACGQQLLQARQASPGGARAWPTAERMMLTGFAHGAAGIAYALLRLYAVTGNQGYLDAAAEGIAYEDQLFVPDAQNWLDLPVPGNRTFRARWCHGAPGIGLARLGGLADLDTAQVQADISAALQTTRHVQTPEPAHLCCGTLGRAELLLEAARRLARPELAVSAEQLAWQVVAEAEQVGRFVLDSRLPAHVDNPGFFQGTAGIGYTLLRLAFPDRLPSVLLWD